jgi:hypothetical protein
MPAERWEIDISTDCGFCSCLPILIPPSTITFPLAFCYLTSPFDLLRVLLLVLLLVRSSPIYPSISPASHSHDSGAKMSTNESQETTNGADGTHFHYT